MAILREDVVWAHRVLLGREPRSEDEVSVVLEHAAGFSLRSLAETFLRHALTQRVGYIVDLLDVKGDPKTPALLISLGAGSLSAAGGVGNGGKSPSMFRGWWGRSPQIPDEEPVGRDDVLWATRLLLGRDPHDEAEIGKRVALGSRRKLVEALVLSPEFSLSGHLSHLFKGHKATASATVAVIGNCQIVNFARCIQALTGDIVPTVRVIVPGELEAISAGTLDLSALIVGHQFIFAHPEIANPMRVNYPAAAGSIRTVPNIIFSAYHPDLVYASVKGAAGWLQGALADYNSSIALYGWLRGLSAAETVRLFNERTYRRLGFFDHWESSRAFLLEEGRRTGFPMEEALARWAKRGCFMHSINHPRLFATADLARILLHGLGIETIPGNPEAFVRDDFDDGAIWPVYPEIGARLGVEGSYLFRLPRFACPDEQPVLVCSLEEFVERSFLHFGQYDKDRIVCDRLALDCYRDLEVHTPVVSPVVLPEVAARDGESVPGKNPYSALPPFHFWRKAVADIEPGELDPVIQPAFSIGRSDKVATAGSCFAQHIAQRLRQQQFNFFITEAAPAELTDNEAAARGYGVFSARYGNLYTARQLKQLLERAAGAFQPVDDAWRRRDGAYVDPFRPQIEPLGFASLDELRASHATHFAAVRRLIESLDVFVFTLGLTEAWQAKADGAVFPLAPGVAGGEMNQDRYEFVNFGVDEVVADLETALARLWSMNPTARVLLTVSPVPLIATYENRHVLVSTTYSKSVLRAAAEIVTRSRPNCAYFPSYEIITGHYNRGAYFEPDLRSVTTAGVDHVMRMFFRHYAPEAAASPVTHADRMREAQQVAAIVCDEEKIVGL